MKWKVTLNSIRKEDNGHGLPRIFGDKPLFQDVIYTADSGDIHLLYELTDPRSDFLNKFTKNCDNGWYRLIVEKQALFAKMLPVKNPKHHTYYYHGYFIVEKIHDQVHIINKYIHVGGLNALAIKNEPRDPQAEVRRTNERYIPSTLPTSKDKTYDELETQKDLIYSYA